MSRSAGLVLGVLAEAVVGDPRRRHPVAAFGSCASAVEGRVYGDTVARGAGFTAAAVAPVVALGVAAELVGRRHPVAHTLLPAAATWAALGARSLVVEGTVMASRLENDDLAAARAQLPNLCGRSPDALDAGELGRATVESLAENTNDAVVCTLFSGALFGVPGMLAHRAVNTLDAMVGHRSDRYARFGTASAVLDDVLAWLPARITGGLACLLAPLVRGPASTAWTTMHRDARDHPSPNGGWCEAAWSGALGVRLGGANTYGDRVEVRGALGEPDAPRPGASEVRRAAELVGWVTAAAGVLAALGTRRKR